MLQLLISALEIKLIKTELVPINSGKEIDTQTWGDFMNCKALTLPSEISWITIYWAIIKSVKKDIIARLLSELISILNQGG
jgi:hypothetical protein